jgi:hypothetical protein
MNAKHMYEVLEQYSLGLDDDGDDDLAEKVRGVMDFLWYRRLSKTEKSTLNARSGVVVAGEDDLYIKPAILPAGQKANPFTLVDVPYTLAAA